MIRVLHFSRPEDAHRRIAFLGVRSDDAARLIARLRPFLLSVPLESGIWRHLPPLLDRKGIPHARGNGVLLLTVSSAEEIDAAARETGRREGPLGPLREAIERYRRREFLLRCRDRSIALSGTPRIMGILNVTPDSFSDGGKFASPERAVERGERMAAEGADIIDVGGESTRPGAVPVPEEVELLRVIPVVRALARRTAALLSVDTTKAEVARRAISEGAHIVNDTSAMADDPGMARVVAESGCAVVLMHRLGRPRTMQRDPSYRSLFGEILDSLEASVAAAEAAGVAEDRILVDPGIGFGKRLCDNLALHRHLGDLRNLAKPILFGPSRKSFLGTITERGPEERVAGTAASVAMAVAAGAHVVRVHDVAAMRDAARVAASVAGGVEC